MINTIKISDILELGMSKYLVNHNLSWKQTKVVNKIIGCGRPGRAVQYATCSSEDCNYKEKRFLPCGDRHCNYCNNRKMLKWMDKMVRDFLPLSFHHVVFTMPSELRNLALCNKEIVYDLFFKAGFEVLKKFGHDKKYFGGELGFIGLLHTWGQTLSYHPHLHFMVLNGGIKAGEYKRLPYSKKFLFPVKAMSKVMMGIFIRRLKSAYNDETLVFPGGLATISSPEKFNWFLYNLSKKEWVIFNQAPLNGTSRVLEYLSRYTHRVAISNHRLKEYSDGKVTFEYKDYKNKNHRGHYLKRLMTLNEGEFIRRYLLHILPEGFRKLRYGGIFASNKKGKSISIIKQFYEDVLEKLESLTEKWYCRIRKYLDVLCPKCEDKLLFKVYGFDSS